MHPKAAMIGGWRGSLRCVCFFLPCLSFGGFPLGSAIRCFMACCRRFLFIVLGRCFLLGFRFWLARGRVAPRSPGSHIGSFLSLDHICEAVRGGTQGGLDRRVVQPQKACTLDVDLGPDVPGIPHILHLERNFRATRMLSSSLLCFMAKIFHPTV